MKQFALLLAALVLLFCAGCAEGENTDESPTIVYGQDVCDRCNMIISEERYAAAYWTEEAEARRFDDIGGMIAYIHEESEAVASYWVHDYASGEWLRAEDATYVMDGELKTPMGFGIAAFADEQQAHDLAQTREAVMVVSFAQLLEMDLTMPSSHSRGMYDANHG